MSVSVLASQVRVAVPDVRAVTATVTRTSRGEFGEPGAVIVIGAVYVFGVSPVGFTVTLRTSVSVVVVPDRGLRANQEALLPALQASDPAPVFVMFSVWEPELVFPSTTVQLRLDGLTPM